MLYFSQNMKEFEILVLVFLSVFSGFGLCKECTNIPTELSSHTFRSQLLSSNNDTWKSQVFSHYPHLIPTDDSGWAGLMPRKALKEQDELNWAVMYKKMKSPVFSAGNFLKEVSLHSVRLNPGSIHFRAQETNLEYLLMLDVDRLVWSFRQTAGLPSPGSPYGGWEGPKYELKGHFVGHYLSATAQMWASTHNDTLKTKMTAVVSALSACQEKLGSGYLSAFPTEFFDRFEAIKPVWAPYYTIHKILAGLLDQYTFAGNSQALKMVKWMVDYFYKRVQNVITKHTIEWHFLSLNEETGGMNDVLYKLFSITGDPKHLVLAHLFDKPCFLGLLAVQADDISGYHANTHIPIVVGSQMRYEITGDSLYKEIGAYFMNIVNSSHSYATGGTSSDEFWSDPKRLADTLSSENEESCTTYNMLKVSRHLFRWTKEMAYADYYERALTNGVLGIQRGTEPGVMIYMLPQRPGSSKAKSRHGWGTPFDSFWCCYGTGIESFSKLGDSIYFEEEGNVPGIYVIQYISSSLDWKPGQIVINQKVDPLVSWDPNLRVTFTFSPYKGATQVSTLNLRVPPWTNSGTATATLNGEKLSLPVPGKFLSITRKWSPGDTLVLQLPVRLVTEKLKDDRPAFASVQAILFGPYLLAGHTSGDWNIKLRSSSSLSDWITPVPESYNNFVVSLSQGFGNLAFVLTSSNQSITMEKFPRAGTDASVHATFRLIFNDSSVSPFWTIEQLVGKYVMLEPFDQPGMRLAQENGNSITVTNHESSDGSSVFLLVSGLDGAHETVSLRSMNDADCFVYSGVNYKRGTSLTLSCNSGSIGTEFNRGASFSLNKGLTSYHPISFVAKGANRNFLLAPLLSFRDESYTAYFNIQA